MNDYIPTLIYDVLTDFFYDLIFPFRSFMYDVETWLIDEFELQLSQDHIAFLIAFFLMVVYILAIIFTIIVLYKGLQFILGLFVR